jgi:hypothetical protein
MEKINKKYGYVPVKNHADLNPWEEIHVDLTGSWIISPKITNDTFNTKESIVKPPQIIALTVIDPVTNYMEIAAVDNKNSATVAKTLDSTWFCQYPRPMKYVHP